MTMNRSTIDEFEFPSGGLAEEVAATAATAVATSEPDEKEEVLGRGAQAEVEFLFLAPEDTINVEIDEEIDQRVDDRQRTVEEALASDFLFAFDQNDVDDGSSSRGIGSAPTPEDDDLQTDAGQAVEQSASSSTESSAPSFPLSLLQAEREQLEREIGNLRRELERHRTMLLELRDGQGLFLPAPAPRRPGDRSLLPATADVLSGMTTVAEPIEETSDFRNSEEFRSALPKASALLGFETAEDGTLLQTIGVEENREFRALAPINLPRERTSTVPQDAENPFLPAIRPLATALADAEINDIQAPLERQTNEIIVPVRWWNAIPAIGFFLLLSTGIGFVAAAAVVQVDARATLQDALHSAPIHVAELESTLAHTEGTFLARFDGRFEYIRARLQDFVNIKNNAQELLTKRRLFDPKVLKLVDRAVERTPAVGWQRLTRAALATAAKSDDAEDSWQTADAARIDDPLFWEMLGDHYRMNGRHDEAMAMFANVVRRKPTASRDVLAMLAEVRVNLAKALEIIPADPIAVLQATSFIRNEEGRSDWREHAGRLQKRLGDPRPTEDGDDLAARGQLQLLLAQSDEAAASYELALKRDPDRNDFRLALAKLRYEQKRFDESSRLVEKIIHSDPASGFGEEARMLRNKIELMTAGRRAATGSVAH